jgi:DNA-binding NarL/FixJ family response regulator
MTAGGVFVQKRVRALSCLSSIADVVECMEGDLAQRLAQVARLLPEAWASPELCAARVVLDDAVYASCAFRESRLKHAAEILVGNQRRGAVEVFWLGPGSEADECFISEEHGRLLDNVAARVSWLVERHQTEAMLRATIQELQAACAALQQSNDAIDRLLQRATTEKQAAQEAIVANVETTLMPVLRALERELPPDQQKYVAVLRDHLKEISSPSADKLSRAFMSLTAVEIRICQMIRDGLTTKGIAERRRVSPATVARQRERIRHKLGLTGTDANLATYLRTFLVEQT